MKTDFSNSELPLRFVSKRSSSNIKTGFQRFQRPVYDYPSKYSPCRAACPAAHDIATALFLASKGRFDLARELFLEESPFPGITGRVCYHPCETACNRAGYDEAVAINALERAIDAYGAAPFEAPKTAYSESVGIVGAGPAGMTCAYHLRLLGYAVTVYDANPSPGGMLSHGIPAYRLPSEVTQKATAELQALGVEFLCGVCVGRDISFEELRRRHNALFLAPGLPKSRKIAGLPETPRVVSGLDFLRAVRANGRLPLSGRVLVLGGGDVAVDAARSAVRCGAASVTICCPEPADGMPAHPQEVSAALAEGIQVVERVLPEAVQQSESGITVRFRRVEAVERGEGGYSFRTGAETAVYGPADYLIYAVGQEAELSFLPDSLRKDGRIACGPFGETAEPGVFAGGDAVGTYNVVNAIASAKRAVVGIDCYLRSRSTEGL
ncbi:MAG: FAD-dependent oxidoreductase, partial [Armatimonadota bacterium]